MTSAYPDVTSASVGDPHFFLSVEELCRGLDGLSAAPHDRGRVELLVRRVDQGRREVLESIVVTPQSGVPGDAWERRPNRSDDMQIAVMHAAVARLIANTQPLTLFGDNLFLDLDLSSESLPCGARVRVGDALLEVTPQPHTGCRKFESRFGRDALTFVWKPELKARNLRGIYLRVLEAGTIRTGDDAVVLR